MQSSNEHSELKLLVEYLDDTDKEHIDNLTTSLMDDLHEFGVQSINKHRENSDVDSKGDPITIGVLLIAVLPAILPSMLDFIKSWTIERRKITVEAPNGAKLEFFAKKKYSEEELIEFIKLINKITKK